LAYVPIHVYWALVGRPAPLGELPETLTQSAWRQANWAACLVLVGAAALSLALVRPWGLRLPRWTLLGIAWIGAAFAILHWVAFSADTVLRLTGVADEPVDTFDRWNLFVLEPWFLGMGVLLAVAARQFARRWPRTSAPGEPATPRTLAGTAFVTLVLGGSFVVLVGVMAFNPWLYAVVGPALVAAGVLCHLVARGDGHST
jgi:hypothetical protein